MIANILVVHSVDPRKLFESVPRDAGPWYVHFHGSSETLAERVGAEVRDRGGRFYPHMRNRSLSESWNDSIEEAMGDNCSAVALLNDDVFFYEGGYEAFLSSSGFGFATCSGKETGSSAVFGEIAPLGFSSCTINRSTIEKVGYFDENFFPAYWEDVDYRHRMILANIDMHYDRRVLAEHERGSTMQAMSAGERANLVEMNVANARYFERKWGGDRSETARFQRPFDADFNLMIPADRRAAPYGRGYDRADRSGP